jgi:tRNA-Thr(GGU) m(6)t(6)A37 methyltransferase TsaA
MRVIGHAKTPFVDRFGVPRQASLFEGSTCEISLLPGAEVRAACRGLEGFTHLWVIFVFDRTGSVRWRPMVRPPRLGGRQKVGVLATRSPHRPNPLGISAVRLISVDLENPLGPRLLVKGLDLLDETPILDIKPYLPYCDSFPEATSGWADAPLTRQPVSWEKQTLKLIDKQAKLTVEDVLGQDPRTGAQKRKNLPGPFGIWIGHFDIGWVMEPTGPRVLSISSEKGKARQLALHFLENSPKPPRLDKRK